MSACLCTCVCVVRVHCVSERLCVCVCVSVHRATKECDQRCRLFSANQTSCSAHTRWMIWCICFAINLILCEKETAIHCSASFCHKCSSLWCVASAHSFSSALMIVCACMQTSYGQSVVTETLVRHKDSNIEFDFVTAVVNDTHVLLNRLQYFTDTFATVLQVSK